jgi:hypothetical protein
MKNRNHRRYQFSPSSSSQQQSTTGTQTVATIDGNMQVNGNVSVTGNTTDFGNLTVYGTTSTVGNLVLKKQVLAADEKNVLIDPKNLTCAFSTLNATTFTSPTEEQYPTCNMNMTGHIVTDTVAADNFSKNHVADIYTRVRTITNSGGFNDILNVGDNEYVLTLIPAGVVPTQPYWVYQQIPSSQQSSEENDDDDHTHNPNGINICPITGKNFDDSEAILASVNGGKTIKVCSVDCKQKVENLNKI